MYLYLYLNPFLKVFYTMLLSQLISHQLKWWKNHIKISIFVWFIRSVISVFQQGYQILSWPNHFISKIKNYFLLQLPLKYYSFIKEKNQYVKLSTLSLPNLVRTNVEKFCKKTIFFDQYHTNISAIKIKFIFC